VFNSRFRESLLKTARETLANAKKKYGFVYMITCAGAMFVSLTSASIPGRGRFAVEVHDRRPCMFVAFEDHEAFRLQEQKLATAAASSATTCAASCGVCGRTFGSRGACTRHERTAHATERSEFENRISQIGLAGSIITSSHQSRADR
jgi:hypothetical protein